MRCFSDVKVDQGACLQPDQAGQGRFRETALEGRRGGGSSRHLVPDAGVARPVIRLPPGMQGHGNQPVVLQLGLDLGEFGGGGRHDDAGVVVWSGSLRPEGGEARGRLSLIPTRSHVSSDLDREVSVLAVSLVGLTNLLDGPIVSEPPGTTITCPDHCYREALAIGIGTKSDRTIPDFRKASAVVMTSSIGIVWQKANRSVSMP